jgi:ActR/RegA family two-component response regulator
VNDQPQVLLVEDDGETLADYLRNLRSDEYGLTGVRSLEEASAALAQTRFDVVVTDLELFDRPDGGMQVLRAAKALDATTGVIMVTGVGGQPDAHRAILELGAREFLYKPLDFTVCCRRIHEAILERRRRLATIEAAARGAFIRIANPYMAGKALGRGSKMFYGRAEVFGFVRDNLSASSHPSHLALVGPRRIGKTSILQQFPERLDPSAFLAVYINCQSLGIDPGMPAFFLKLSRQICGSLQANGVDVSGLAPLTESDLRQAPALTFTDTFLAQVWRALGSRRLLFCLDEFEELEHSVRRGRLDAVVFDFLRELMRSEERIVCILAGTRRLEELGDASQEAGSILDMVAYRRIGVLRPELARRLIEEPVADHGMGYQEEAITQVQHATGGHPYLIHLLCGALVNRRNEQQRDEMTLEDVDAAIAAVIEGPQPGFFWETLTPYQQAVLIAASWLVLKMEPITSHSIAAQLQAFGLSWADWSTPIVGLLHQLALEELLREETSGGQTFQYRLAFDLLGDWVRRHKAIDQIRKDIDHD